MPLINFNISGGDSLTVDAPVVPHEGEKVLLRKADGREIEYVVQTLLHVYQEVIESGRSNYFVGTYYVYLRGY